MQLSDCPFHALAQDWRFTLRRGQDRGSLHGGRQARWRGGLHPESSGGRAGRHRTGRDFPTPICFPTGLDHPPPSRGLEDCPLGTDWRSKRKDLNILALKAPNKTAQPDRPQQSHNRTQVAKSHPRPQTFPTAPRSPALRCE